MNRIIKELNNPMVGSILTIGATAINVLAKREGIISWDWVLVLWPLWLPEAALGWLMLATDLFDRK